MSSKKSPQSVYDRYRPQLTILAEDRRIAPAIADIGAQQGWWGSNRHWRRPFARFDPDCTPFVSMLYETTDLPQTLCTVEVFAEPPALSDKEAISLGCSPKLWIHIIRFPNDPTLPGLHHILANSRGHPHVVRYMPGKRCTIRFEAANPTESCFAKVFKDNQGALIHAESQNIWEAAAHGKLGFTVAQPMQWDTQMRTLWQGMVPGRPIIENFIKDEGAILAGRLGKAAASITQFGLQPQTVFDGKEQMARSTRYVQDFKKRIPDLSDSLTRLLDHLSTIHQQSSQEDLFPIHGTPHAHQWLDDGAQLGLVDFDRFSLGDRENDAATFLTELEFEGWIQPWVAQIKKAFLSGYESVAGSLSPLLLSAYGAHKCLAKAYKVSRSVRSDGELRARRYLRKADQAL